MKNDFVRNYVQLACSLLALTSAQINLPVAATELLPDYSLKDKQLWSFKGATISVAKPALDTPMVELAAASSKADSYSYFGARADKVPANHKLSFECLVRGEFNGQKITVNAFAKDKNDKAVSSFHSDIEVSNNSWKKFTTTYVVPPECKYLSIWICNTTKHLAYCAKPSLKLGAFEQAPITANSSLPDVSNPTETKILLGKVTTPVRAAFLCHDGTVTLPVPSTYKEQIPLAFEVTTEPPEALLGYSFKKREDGLNYLCQVKVAPPAKGAAIHWRSLVLVTGKANEKLAKAQPTISKESEAWTASTLCVQSNDPEIQAKAKELAKNAPDVESFARKVIAFTADNKGTGAKFISLDAKSAMSCGGSCTSRANLGAALLRAHGVPARTMSHLPAWYAGKMYEHWLTEYWHPGVGWVPLETTLGAFQAPANTYITLAISSTADENKASDALHLRTLMPGGAYLSGGEVDNNLYLANIPNTDGVNSAEVIGVFKADPVEIRILKDAAMKNFVQVYSSSANAFCKQHSEAIESAATTGNLSMLLKALAIKK